MQGWYRVKEELEIHHKQKDTRKYQRRLHQYAFPLEQMKISDEVGQQLNREVKA